MALKKMALSIVKLSSMILIFLSFSTVAHAVCASPAGVEGQLQWIAAYGQVRFCNGTSWVAMNNTATGTACTPAGKVQYVSSQIMYCNGSVWVMTAPAVNHGACAATLSGKFYYDITGNYYWFCNGTNWRRMGP